MAKIKLKAHIPLHRDIARLFVGQYDVVGFKIIHACNETNQFLLYNWNNRIEYYDDVTIDLSTPMDLRVAIGCEFLMESTTGESLGYLKGCYQYDKNFLEYEFSSSLNFNENEKDDIWFNLSVPWLKSKEIEVIE